MEQLNNGPEPEKPWMTFELVSQYFCMPIKQAARELKVGETVLKKRCRELGIRRWPGREVRSLQNLIDHVKELGKDDTPQEAKETEMVVQKLQQRKKLMEECPHVKLDNETKEFRQACYKEKYIRQRKRKLGIHEGRDTEALMDGAATLQRIALGGHGGDAETGATPMFIEEP